MASIGDSLASGIESGFRMGQQADAAEEAKRARTVQEDFQRQTQNRLQQEWEGQQDLRAMQAAAAMRKELADEGTRLAQQYGKSLPPEIAGDYTTRARQAQQAHTAALQKLMPQIESYRQGAKNLFSDLQAGNVDLGDVPPEQMYRAVVAGTGRPISDFRPGPNGEPSVIGAAVKKLQTGMQTGNEEYVLEVRMHCSHRSCAQVSARRALTAEPSSARRS